MRETSERLDERWIETLRRHEAARLQTLRSDASRQIGANLEEGAKLAFAATSIAQAFAAARR